MSISSEETSTKKDLLDLKKELMDKLATKDEIQKLATKDEIKKLATKEELYEVENKLIGEIVWLKTEISKLETKAEAERKFNLIMQAIDNLTAKIDAYQAEKAAIDHALGRHETLIEDHESRIQKLEKANT